MKIAIDIDNTIFSCDSLLYRYVVRFFVKQKKQKKGSVIEINKIKPMVYKEGLSLFSKIHNSEYYNQVDNSVTVINLLKSEGHEIYVVSARPKDKFSKNVIFNLMLKYGLKFDKLVLNCKNKVDYCKQREIDVMIDDQYKICEACAKNGTDSICLVKEKPNIKQKPENLYFVNSWSKADDVILNLIKEKNNQIEK